MTAVSSRHWFGLAFGLAALIIGLLSWLHFTHSHELQTASLHLRELRQARIDLTKGFLTTLLADNPAKLFRRDQGETLITQATESLENLTATVHAMQSDEVTAFRNKVKAFRQRLTAWQEDSARPAEKLLKLRIAFAELERQADQLDAHGQQAITALQDSNERHYAYSLSAAILALGVLIAVLFMLAGKERNAITEQLRLAQANRDSEERFSHLFHEAPVPLCFVDKTGVLRDRNRHFDMLLGYNHDELRTLDEWWPLAYPDPAYRAWVQDTWRVAVAEAARGGSDIAPIEYRVRCKDGSERVMLISGIVLGEDVLVTFFDITERSQAAQSLKTARLAALNQMEDANAARRELAELNASLECKVVERTTELTAANQELDAFAYAVSHDLRAPLRAMSGFASALIEDYGKQLPGGAQTYLEQIGIASRRMSELIDGLLALSRSTRGELQRDVVDLSALARRHLEELARVEPQRQVAVSVEPGLRARGDVSMIDAVLGNLLGNAWKYTAKTTAPQIHVYRGEAAGRTGFCIADNGAGFDMAHAGRLFKPFQRLHRQEEFPGIGIGLATVQRIVRRHGGEIVASGEPGRGAIFCFTLPEGVAQERSS